MRIVRSPWSDRFDSLVADAIKDLLISSPFVSEAACERLVYCVTKCGRAASIRILLVVNLSLENIVSGATSASALVALVKQLPQTSLRFIPTLHAKAYIADGTRAIITSANLTAGGLYRNLEYGVEFDEPAIVREIRRDVEDYAALGPLVPIDTLCRLAVAANRVAAERTVAEKDAGSQVQRAIATLLNSAGDEVLRARTAGRSLTAILEDTIVYLLSRGPKTTPEIHSHIQHIHPDLCDDNIDRVIDGRSYGKRWKHSVRTAQSHLKERGKAVLVRGRWRLAGNEVNRDHRVRR
ncbi:MAG: hypothetical protein HUU22_11735 [Phycisphaerae bacterium]|nr:phospholipase D-like domain-containing protein [Phycisphaerae bacterium]NUQ46693.1 hypothetical protein [Phycisphaerae bacterium]